MDTSTVLVNSPLSGVNFRLRPTISIVTETFSFGESNGAADTESVRPDDCSGLLSRSLRAVDVPAVGSTAVTSPLPFGAA
jgi:hypothetical protein